MSKSGYTRWDDSNPLDHETRGAIYETVTRSPGAYLSEIRTSVEVPLSTTRYHLDVLEHEGVVSAAKLRGKRRNYPGRDDEIQLIAALEDEGPASVLFALARLGEASGTQLAEDLGCDASTVSHHLSRLEKTGLIEREREGRTVVNRVDSSVRKEITTTGESPR